MKKKRDGCKYIKTKSEFMKQPKKIKRQMINSINCSIYSNRINKRHMHKGNVKEDPVEFISN